MKLRRIAPTVAALVLTGMLSVGCKKPDESPAIRAEAAATRAENAAKRAEAAAGRVEAAAQRAEAAAEKAQGMFGRDLRK